MIKTLGRSFKWAPEVYKNMYCDAEDFEGIMFWYNDVTQQHKEIEAKKPKK
jgi:hypothetical protein